MASSKHHKNRSILRTIDTDAIQQSGHELIAYICVFVLLLSFGGLYSELPRVAISSGILIGLMTVVRGMSYIRFDHVYSCGPARWRREFYTLHCINRLIWGCFCGLIIYYNGVNSTVFVVTIFTLGLCALSLLSLSPYPGLYKISLTFTLIPSVAALFFHQNSYNAMVSLILLGFYYIHLKQAESQHQKFWQQIELVERYKSKTYEYEESKLTSQADNTVKLAFLSNLTDEIRTPMNNILGMLSLLGDTPLDKEQTEFHTIATDAGVNLLSLVNDVLDFSQLTAGNLVLESKVFNLRTSIGELMEMQGPIAHAKGIELSCVFDPNIPLRVRGDQHRLNQIIRNLIANAIKFSDSGEIIVEVHMTNTANREGLLRVHVTYQGIGIPTSKRDSLFDSCLNNDLSTSTTQGGQGLGLAICKSLTQQMNGDIGVISEPGRGSTFWFTCNFGFSTQQAQQSFQTRNLRNQRVLIVNAALGCSKSLAYELTSWGLHCDEISEPAKALQVLRATAHEGSTYDLVVLDLGLDSTRTLTLSSVLAEDPALPRCRQIVLTSLVQRGSQSCVQHKAKIDKLSYLTKPVLRQSLWDAVASLFDLSHDHDNRFEQPVKAADNTEKKSRVLLVEDNRVNQIVIKTMLLSLGHAVKVVSSGSEALGIIADNTFDIILMDCLMPTMSGYETTKEIRLRNSDRATQVPIIAMTSSTLNNEQEKCSSCGMNDFLPKPLNTDVLNTKLNYWLDKTNLDTGVIQISQQSR